jgi:hypothetical protein
LSVSNIHHGLAASELIFAQELIQRRLIGPTGLHLVGCGRSDIRVIDAAFLPPLNCNFWTPDLILYVNLIILPPCGIDHNGFIIVREVLGAHFFAAGRSQSIYNLAFE